MIPKEMVPIWGPDGESILTFGYKHHMLLPQGHVVLVPDPGSEPNPEDPSRAMIAFRVDPVTSSQYGIGESAANQAQIVPSDERHITLVDFGELDKLDRKRLHTFVRKWLAESDWASLEGKAQGWGTFTPGKEKKPVLWMSWDIPGLNELRTQLFEDLKKEGFTPKEEHDFLPHETVAYMENGEIKELPPFPDPAPGQDFNAIIVAEGDTWTEYPFPMAMALRPGSTMSLTAALESATYGFEGWSDPELGALIAAGGADKNRGNAETLRRYWTVGPGGAKIKWGTKGDWKRCVKQLSKHMGLRARGYCQLRHKEMTRMWTGDMKHRILYGWGGKPGSYWAKVAAQSLVDEHNNVLVATSGEPMPEENPILMMLDGPQQAPVAFEIPLLLPEGIESGDGRTFNEGVTEVRELPIPLLWQPNSMQGHDGAAIVGRIDNVERVEGGLGNATGVFDTSPLAMEAVRMIREGFLRGVSADLDMFEAKVKGKGPGISTAKEDKEAADSADSDDDETIMPDKMDITKGRVMAATLVAKPAFQECIIKVMEAAPLPDGEYVQPIGPQEQEIREALAQLLREHAMASFAITASAGFKVAPIYPPTDWFDDPQLSKPTHLSITDDGRVYGHIAAWNVNHIGMGYGLKPPKSRSGYAYFRTGLLRTKEGTDVRVGQLTLAGGHATLEMDVRETVRHYDDTASAWADVSAGEDRHGIWVAGALRPTVTQEQVRAARASSPSGDWRPINGKLELVAVCSVNVPGFPVVEARVAGGQVLALVAAGVMPLYEDELATLDPAVAVAALRERVNAPYQRKALELSAKMAKSRMLSNEAPSTQRRKAMSKKGVSMPDGSFAIADVEDLKRAIRTYNRSTPADYKSVRNHIEKRAKALGQEELIPAEWKDLSVLSTEETSVVEFRDYSTDKRKQMEKSGTAMKGGRYPIADVEDLKNAIQAYGRGAPEDKPAIRKHIQKRAKALGHPELIPENWKKLSTLATVLIASVRSFATDDWDEEKHVRDEMGQFRKVYYRLSETPGSDSAEVKAAIDAVENAAKASLESGETDVEATTEAQKQLETAAESGTLDEETKIEIIKAAEEMANLVSRVEARGDKTMIQFSQLPAAIQDVMKEYMKHSNLEPRIEKHFGPYIEGEVTRSVEDVINFIERIIVDQQMYYEGYDKIRA